MRILHVTNELAPHGSGDVAEHVWAIAREQAQRHEVALFVGFDDPNLPTGYVYTERRERVTIRFFNRRPLEWTPFERTYIHRDVEVEFKLFLGEHRSDVVHFHDIETLGVTLMEIVHSLNIKAVFTARDFWPMCARKNRVCRSDGSTCDRIDLSKCGTCVLGEEWGKIRAAELAAHEARRPAPPETFTQLWKRLYKQRYDATRGLTARRPLAMLHATKVSLREAKWKAQEQLHEKFGDSIERRMGLFSQRLRDLDLLIAPSEYVRDQYVSQFGLQPSKAIYSATGRDVTRLATLRKSTSSALRMGFIGTLAREDGLALLLEAFLPAAASNGRLELHIHVKCASHERETLENLRAQAAGFGMSGRVHWHEDYDAARVHDVLSELDLLVVPKLGLGNAPSELEWAAFHGVPILTSDSGGLADFCRAHSYGRTFARGDANALTLQLAALGAGDALLADYAGKPLKFKTPQYEAERLVQTYHELLYGKYKAPTKEQQAAERTGPLAEPVA